MSTTNLMRTLCSVCLRPLTSISSIEIGMGPSCAKRRQAYLAELATVGHRGAELGIIRHDEDVVLTLNRTTGNLDSNIPRTATWMSGEKHGYGFSEPQATDLAVNILGAMGMSLSPYGVMLFGGRFANEFIRGLPPEGAVIKRKAIMAWIAKHTSLLADHNPHKEH